MAYTNTIRNNAGLDLSSPELRRDFPALFNHTPARHCSESYQLYRSNEIAEQMLDKGMKLVEVGVQKSRARPAHTQLHTMRFQPVNVPLTFGVNDSVPEVVVLNGHDGRNRFRAFAGVFRFICANGMVVADSMLGQVVKRHFGEANAFDKVQAILADLPETVNKVHNRILDWSAMTLTELEQVRLAAALIDARQTPDWVTPEIVLQAKRIEEQPVEGKRNLWTTFNVLQENLTNTELLGDPDDRRIALRPLAGAFRNLQANSSLWSAADAYYNAAVDGLTDEEKEGLAKARRAAYDRTRTAIKRLENA